MTAMNSGLTIYSGVPLDNSYENTFTSVSLLSNFPHVTVYSTGLNGSPAYYIRPDRKTVQIKHNGNMNVGSLNLYKCNYITFVNANYENTRFYAFITDVRYVNDKTAEIDFEIDVMMTWLQHNDQENGCTFKECFVEREHVLDDTIGKHLIAEDIDVGDYLYDIKTPLSSMTTILVVMIAGYYSSTEEKWVESIHGMTIQGPLRITNTINYYLFDKNGNNGTQGFSSLESLLMSLMDEGKEGWVKAIYYAPVFSTSDEYLPTLYATINRPSSIDNYTPKNNKMLTYPYVCCCVDNYEGVNIDLPFEFSYNNSGESINLLGYSNYLDSSASLYPSVYDNSYAKTIVKKGYGVLTTSESSFNTYQAQFRNTANAQAISNIIMPAVTGALIGGGPVGAAIGAGAGLISLVGNALAKGEQARINGASVGGSNSGILPIQNGTDKFGISVKHIRKDYAQSIDGYFTKFGYKINKLKTPSFANGEMRLNWKYIKTIGCAIDGYAPATDMSKIEEIMDNGITFWKTKDVGDYTFPTQGGE